MPDAHLRLSVRQLAKLDALAKRSGLTRSAQLRRLIDSAASDVRIPGERLTESELLDLLHEQAKAGRVAAIVSLLRREDQRDDVDRLIESVFGDVDFPG